MPELAQFGESVNRMRGYAREHVAEPGKWLDPASLAHGDETHQHGRGLATMGAFGAHDGQDGLSGVMHAQQIRQQPLRSLPRPMPARAPQQQILGLPPDRPIRDGRLLGGIDLSLVAHLAAVEHVRVDRTMTAISRRLRRLEAHSGLAETTAEQEAGGRLLERLEAGRRRQSSAWFTNVRTPCRYRPVSHKIG